jgi:hypothetical protein
MKSLKVIARLARRALPLVGIAAAGLAVFPGMARAQDGGFTGSSGYGISLASTVVQRYYPNSTTNAYPFRAANLNPNDINFQDCEDNIHLVFNMLETGGTAGGSSQDILQVWAGTTDCTQTTARSGAESPFCWQVAAAQLFVLNGTFDIYARQLTRYIDTTLDSVPNSGNPPSDPAGAPESACHTQTSSGQVALNIYFMFLPNTGDATPDASFSYSLNADLVGPLAPYNLTVGIGDQLLLLNWSSQIDSTIQGFNIYAQDQGANGLGIGSEGGATTVTTPIYCHQSGSTSCPDASGLDGATDSTTSADACTTTFSDASAYTEVLDATSYSSMSDADLAAIGCVRSSPVKGVSTGQLNGGACSSTVLVDKFTSNVSITTTEDDGGTTVDGAVTSTVTSVDGAGATGLVGISEIDASVYGVGNVGGNTTSSFNVENLANGDRLINGHQYAIAVAAYDDDGNVGLLSNLVCQTPEPIVDFWDRYTADGGTAGGGFCALEAPGVPVAGSMFGMGVGVAIVALARRRRRRNHSTGSFGCPRSPKCQPSGWHGENS